jgi:ADP-heptose:LPS heptosyltransferase
MRGRYLVQSTAGLTYLTLLDTLLGWRRNRREEPSTIKQLLIGVGGHLGDAVIASSVLPVIMRGLPGVQIGVAAPSWVMSVFENHPVVKWTHRIDHWKVNRSSISRFAKFRRSVATHRRALAEIRAVGYDAAVDLYAFYPNMAVLFGRARIPVRAGFESGGGGPLYTRRLPWAPDSGHVLTNQLRIVSELGIYADNRDVKYCLPPVGPEDENNARSLLAEAALAERFIVLHPGTGDQSKAWPLERWRELATSLVSAGRRVVVTGAGQSEREAGEWLREYEPSIVNLSDRTNVPQLRVVLRRAVVVVASDSSAGHLAAAEGTPVVSVMGGPSDPQQWKPLSTAGVVLREGPDGHVSVEAVLREAVRLAGGITERNPD